MFFFFFSYVCLCLQEACKSFFEDVTAELKIMFLQDATSEEDKLLYGEDHYVHVFHTFHYLHREYLRKKIIKIVKKEKKEIEHQQHYTIYENQD